MLVRQHRPDPVRARLRQEAAEVGLGERLELVRVDEGARPGGPAQGGRLVEHQRERAHRPRAESDLAFRELQAEHAAFGKQAVEVRRGTGQEDLAGPGVGKHLGHGRLHADEGVLAETRAPSPHLVAEVGAQMRRRRREKHLPPHLLAAQELREIRQGRGRQGLLERKGRMPQHRLADAAVELVPAGERAEEGVRHRLRRYLPFAREGVETKARLVLRAQRHDVPPAPPGLGHRQVVEIALGVEQEDAVPCRDVLPDQGPQHADRLARTCRSQDVHVQEAVVERDLHGPPQGSRHAQAHGVLADEARSQPDPEHEGDADLDEKRHGQPEARRRRHAEGMSQRRRHEGEREIGEREGVERSPALKPWQSLHGVRVEGCRKQHGVPRPAPARVQVERGKRQRQGHRREDRSRNVHHVQAVSTPELQGPFAGFDRLRTEYGAGGAAFWSS